MKTQLIAIFALLFISVAASAAPVESTFDDPNNELSPMGKVYNEKKKCTGRKDGHRTEMRAGGTAAPQTVRTSNGSTSS